MNIGCLRCSDYHPNCNSCDHVSCSNCTTGYVAKLTFGCIQCIQYHPSCLTCDSTHCLSCSGTLLPNLILGCKSCPDYHPQCTGCSVTQCTTCNPGYGVHLTSGCVLCTTYHPQCTSCADPTCLTCGGGFFVDPVLNCKQCTDYHPNCTTCTTSLCTSCTNQFIPDTTLGCISCSSVQDPECLTCDVTQCLQCIVNSYLNFTTNNQTCDSCNFFKCTACTDGPQCTACQSKYFLYPINFTCDPCDNLCKQCYGISSNCTACYNWAYNTNNSCFLGGCMNTVYYLGNFICLSCDIQHNFAVFNTTCKCNIGYRTISPLGVMPYCQNNCGDGILTQPSQACDDGNLIQNDGCYLCQTQNDFICYSTSPSKCVLHINFYLFQFNYVYKVQSENKAILTYTIQPKHMGLKKSDWQKLITLNISSLIKGDSLLYIYSADTGELKIQFNYLQEIQNQILQTKVNFNPDFVVSDPSGYLLQNKLNGINAPLIFEQTEMLNACQASLWVSQILIIFLMIQYFLGSYFNKMIGIQTLQVLQFFYFSKMIVSSKSTSILNSLNTLKVSCSGYSNIETFLSGSQFIGRLQKQKFTTIDAAFLRTDLQKYFLLNVNFFLSLLIISGIVYLVYLVKKIVKRNQFIQNKDNYAKDQYTILKRSKVRMAIINQFLFKIRNLVQSTLSQIFNYITLSQPKFVCHRLVIQKDQIPSINADQRNGFMITCFFQVR